MTRTHKVSIIKTDSFFRELNQFFHSTFIFMNAAHILDGMSIYLYRFELSHLVGLQSTLADNKRQYLCHSNILENRTSPLLFFKIYYWSLWQRWKLRVIAWVIKYHAALLFPKYWLDVMAEGASAFSSLLIHLKPIFSVTRLHFSHLTASELSGREQNDLPLLFKSIRTWHMECP